MSSAQDQSQLLHVAQDSFYRCPPCPCPVGIRNPSSYHPDEHIYTSSVLAKHQVPMPSHRDLTLDEQANISAHNFDHPNVRVTSHPAVLYPAFTDCGMYRVP